MKIGSKLRKNTKFDKYWLLTLWYYKRLFSAVYSENRDLDGFLEGVAVLITIALIVGVLGILLYLSPIPFLFESVLRIISSSLSLSVYLVEAVRAILIYLFVMTGVLIAFVTGWMLAYTIAFVYWAICLIFNIERRHTLDHAANEIIDLISSLLDYLVNNVFKFIGKCFMKIISYALKGIIYAVVTLPVFLASFVVPILSACVSIFSRVDDVEIESKLTGIEEKYIRFKDFDPNITEIEYKLRDAGGRSYVVKSEDGNYYSVGHFDPLRRNYDELPKELLHKFGEQKIQVIYGGYEDSKELFYRSSSRYNHKQVFRTVYGDYFNRAYLVQKLSERPVCPKTGRHLTMEYVREVFLKKDIMTLVCCAVKRVQNGQDSKTSLKPFVNNELFEPKLISEIFSFYDERVARDRKPDPVENSDSKGPAQAFTT